MDNCILEEERDEGRCECIVFLEEAILFKDMDGNCCKFTGPIKMADYLLFHKKDDKWVAHIIEIKKTINQRKWNKIKIQFRNVYIRALGFKSILGIEVEDYRFITLFQNDDTKKSNNLNELKHTTALKSELKDWEDGYCEIKHIDGNLIKFEHKAHKLPEVQKGNETMFAGQLIL